MNTPAKLFATPEFIEHLKKCHRSTTTVVATVEYNGQNFCREDCVFVGDHLVSFYDNYSLASQNRFNMQDILRSNGITVIK